MGLSVNASGLPQPSQDAFQGVVVITSDQSLPNPVLTLLSGFGDVYLQLGILPSQWSVAVVSYVRATQPAVNIFSYSFQVGFVRAGSSLAQSFRGVPGPAGPAGPQGPQGPFGGPTGPAGPPGIQGPIGATGIQGIQGPQGGQGNIGSTGAAGPTGAPGATGPAGAGRFQYPSSFPVQGSYMARPFERVPYNPSAGVTFPVFAPSGPLIGDRFGVKNITASTNPILISGNPGPIENPSGFTLSPTFTFQGAGSGVAWEWDGREWLVVAKS